MWDKIPADWVAGFVVAALSYVGHKLWGRASDRQKKMIEGALDEIRSIIRSLVISAKPGTTVDEIQTWCKGAVAIRLAKYGLKKGDKYVSPVIEPLANALVAEGITLFVDLHPEKATVAAPILKRLAP